MKVEVLGDFQGPKFRVGELKGEPVQLAVGSTVTFALETDENDLITDGRITMKPTLEQTALLKVWLSPFPLSLSLPSCFPLASLPLASGDYPRLTIPGPCKALHPFVLLHR